MKSCNNNCAVTQYKSHTHINQGSGIQCHVGSVKVVQWSTEESLAKISFGFNVWPFPQNYFLAAAKPTGQVEVLS